MKQELKHVNFYRLSLLRGCYSGLKVTEEHALALHGTAAGCYITPMFDTGEQGCTFNRLLIDGYFAGAKLEVLVAATDETDVFLEDKPQNLQSYFKNPHVSAEKKAEALQHFPHFARYANTQDILLHQLEGRYIWIYVALYPMERCACVLEGMRLELPKYSFTEYFPEVYRGNDFFDRYIGIFQSAFLDVERLVDNVPNLLDYRTSPPDNIEYLAGWLGIDNSRGLFTAAQLRYLIENVDLFQGAKGTKRALEQIVLLFTGVAPKILEHFAWQRPQFSAEQLAVNKRLYGETDSHFCVILNLTEKPLAVDEKDLEFLIEQYSVLGAQFKVVYLTRCTHTDSHCYLDVNAALSVPEVAGLDGTAFGEHITVG